MSIDELRLTNASPPRAGSEDTSRARPTTGTHSNFEFRISNFPSRGFTLIELLVVMGIIGVLASLVFFAAAKMRGGATESQCRAMLGGLTGVAAMYETSTGIPIEHLDKAPFSNYWSAPTLTINYPQTTAPVINQGDKLLLDGDLTSDETSLFNASEQTRHRNANLFIERFVWVTLQIPEVRDRFVGLGENAFVDLDHDGFAEIRDPWGHNIAYGKDTSRGNSANTDADFLPDHPSPFFASAGTDGLWGESYTESDPPTGGWNNYTTTSNYADSRDNLYSFDIDRSSAETQR
ncbi:MAG: type II secretion system protein [Phycisphaeraceae bacterium]|nr:type II secretion system protein [Phycisphaeraceae bacterium]